MQNITKMNLINIYNANICHNKIACILQMPEQFVGIPHDAILSPNGSNQNQWHREASHCIPSKRTHASNSPTGPPIESYSHRNIVMFTNVYGSYH